MILPTVTLGPNQIPDILGNIGDSLTEAAKRRDARKKEAADALYKQQEAARQDRLVTGQLANYQSEADARTHQQEQADALQHLTATKDIQASLDAGKTDEANLKAKAYKIKAYQEVGQKQGDTVMPPTPVDLTAPPAPGQAPADVEASNAAAIANNAPMEQRQGAWNIGGARYDPAQTKAAEDATREETAQRSGAAYEPLGYGNVAQALVRGSTGAKPVEVDSLIAQRMKNDEADKERKALLDQRETFQADQADKYKLNTDQQIRHQLAMEAAAREQAHARTAASAGLSENRNDMATNRNLTTYMGTVKEFENNAGVKPDVAMMKNIGKIHEELTSKPTSPIAQAAAIDTISQIAQGGKASQGVMAQINAHALGPVEALEDKVYQAGHNGAHSPAWVTSMTNTLDGLKKFATTEQGRVMTGFEAAAGDQSPFAGPEYSGLRDSQRRKIAASLGMEVPPPAAPVQGAMQPGTGQRARPDNPLIRAAKGETREQRIARLHSILSGQ